MSIAFNRYTLHNAWLRLESSKIEYMAFNEIKLTLINI